VHELLEVLDQERHALWTQIELYACQQDEKKVHISKHFYRERRENATKFMLQKLNNTVAENHSVVESYLAMIG
jgi:hypothetical protein